MQIVGGTELQHVRCGRERFGLAGDQQRVRAGRAAHGLRGVVDEDVERTVGGNRVGQRHDLAGLAQVDPDDVQAIDPIGAVGHRREAARRVLREAGRDRRVRAVAQQPQRDVHADLRAPAGEQRASPGEIGAGLTALSVERRAVRAELVVEGVDLGVLALALVTRSRADQRAGGRARRARQLDAARLVVDPPGRRRGRGGEDAAVGGGYRRSALGAAQLLHRLEDLRGRAAHRHRLGMLDRELLDAGEHGQARLEVVAVDFRHKRWNGRDWNPRTSLIGEQRHLQEV